MAASRAKDSKRSSFVGGNPYYSFVLRFESCVRNFLFFLVSLV